MMCHRTMKTIVQWLWFWALSTAVLSAEEKTGNGQNVDTTRRPREIISIQPISSIVASIVIDGSSTIESQFIETHQRTGKGSVQTMGNGADDLIALVHSYLSPINPHLVFFSTLVSLIGTWCLMLIVARPTRTSYSYQVNRKTNDESFGFIQRHDTNQKVNLQTRISSEIDSPCDAVVISTGGNNGVFTRRLCEEAALAMRFKQHTSTTAVARKIGLLQNCAVLEDRVSFARTVGMARGEIELALHLQELQASIVQQGGQQ